VPTLRDLPSAVLGFALMVAFVPGWGGLATTPRWDLGVIMALALFVAPARRLTAVDGLGLALIAWLCLSIVWSSSPLDGIDTALKLCLIVVAFGLGASIDNPRPLIAGAAIGMAISSVLAVAQWYGWDGVITIPGVSSDLLDGWDRVVARNGAPSGLFFGRDRLGETAALVLAGVIGLRMWWSIGLVLPALVLAQERNAWLAAAVIVLIAIWQRGRTFERFVIVAIMIHGALFTLIVSTGVDVPWKMASLVERVVIWKFTIANLTWLGHGLGSFIVDGPVMAWSVSPGSDLVNMTRVEHPHNEWLWLAYEGGVAAVGLGAAIALAIGRCVSRCSGHLGLVLVALFVVSLFAMPFHDPAAVLLSALVAGHLVGDRVRLRAAAVSGRGALYAGVVAGRYGRSQPYGTHPGGGIVPIPASVSRRAGRAVEVEAGGAEGAMTV